MDVVLPEPDKLKIVSHRQYNPPESLSPTSVLPSPLDQFRKWFTEVQGKVDEPEAMSLSTATAKGVPSSRFVLLKQADKKGFVFYTNYTSRKSLELEENPYAALAFYWKAVHRQVRVIGRVEKVSREESEEYFTSRPVGSRLGAWASDQSKAVGETEVHDKLEQVKAKFGVTEGTENAQVPLPDHWGGWRVIPEYVVAIVITCRILNTTLAASSSFGRANPLAYTTASATYASRGPRMMLLSGRSIGSLLELTHSRSQNAACYQKDGCNNL